MSYSYDEIESLKKDFGLTDEEIDGFLEFFDEYIEEAENNGRVINIGSKKEEK